MNLLNPLIIDDIQDLEFLKKTFFGRGEEYVGGRSISSRELLRIWGCLYYNICNQYEVFYFYDRCLLVLFSEDKRTCYRCHDSRPWNSSFILISMNSNLFSRFVELGRF